MKTTRARLGAFFAVAALSAGLPLAAQVDFITVTRTENFIQTGVSAVSANPTNTFEFTADVQGSGLTGSSPLTAATVTLPSTAVQSLAFDSSSGSWRYRDSTPTSMANLNTTYGLGNYVFNLTGTPSGSAPVAVGSFGSGLLATPVLTLSGGSWVGNNYVISDTSLLTIAMNAIYTGTPASNAIFHFDAGINGNSFINGPNDFVNWDPTKNSGAGGAANYASTPPNFTVTGGTLTAGNYTIEVGYDDVTNFGPSALSGVNAAGLLEYRTTISLQVIPEPSPMPRFLVRRPWWV